MIQYMSLLIIPVLDMQPNNFNSMNGMTSNVMRPSTAAMNAVAAALDRRQQMPTSVLDFNSDHFMAQNPLPSRNTMPNQHSNGRWCLSGLICDIQLHGLATDQPRVC